MSIAAASGKPEHEVEQVRVSLRQAAEENCHRHQVRDGVFTRRNPRERCFELVEPFNDHSIEQFGHPADVVVHRLLTGPPPRRPIVP